MYTFHKLKEITRAAVDETVEAADMGNQARDFYDGHQFTEAEIAVLKKRGQRPNAWNRVRGKVDAMVGIEQQARTDPKALPRHPGAEDAADVATKSLTFIDDNTRFDHQASGSFENKLVEGTGAVDIIVKPVRGRMETVIERVRWEELVYDPRSREKDFSDAAYLGRMRWMYIDDAMALYKDVYDGDLLELLMQSGESDTSSDKYEDRPETFSNFSWVDEKQKRVRIVSLYYKYDGKWHLAIFCGGGEIYNQVSPYHDEDGEPTCTIEAMSAYVDRYLRRYGVVWDMIAPQDEVNKRRSKALHHFTSRQTVAPKGAIPDVAGMKRELADPNGHIEYDAEAVEDLPTGVKPFDILPTGDQSAGQFALLNEAKEEIDRRGPSAALQGQLTGNQSGKAIRAQQQAGFAEMAPIYDGLNDWKLRCYRAMWARAKQFWTEERYIRISGERGATEFVAVNQVVGFEGQPQPDGTTRLMPVFANRMGEMDVDITIDDTPDYATLMEQSFEQMTSLATAGVPIPPDMLIEASSLPNKDRVLERMEEREQQQVAMAQQAGRVEQADKAADIGKKKASAMLDVAKAQNTQVDTQMKAVGLA